ncbi:MAG: chromosome segregation protein SMC [Verrucomicrobia bacterium]|nr:chromosome segregation protein SMC [Verrucomicrobiota bacterium]
MYLKNLTVLGFKSFADKTSLSFQPGVTAIVGPNGCGKSNVSDAIRWVLGEQSAKAMRGGEMADVIFNGTDGRKPLGMSEVSLTIGGVDAEHLVAAGVEVAYNEVTVTRRIFRDGTSEYFMNKTPCRLKDIQQLFMGTGVGRASYSMMAQGNITQLLSSKPEDRRLVFEEAAGITKYKAQKREALHKLDATDQNLLRVEDLIREVKRQIISLQRQAGKARRYKQLMIELQHLDTQFARHQFDVLQADMDQRQAALRQCRQDIEHATDEVLRREHELAQLRTRLSELEHAISQHQQRAVELKAQADHHRSRIQFNEERIRETESQHGSALHEIALAEERCRAAREEQASLAEGLASATAALGAQRQALQTKHDAMRQVETALRENQEALRQAQAAAFAQAQQLTRVRNEITALDLLTQGNAVRLEKLSAEKIQLEEERARLEDRLRQHAADSELQRLSVQAQRGTLEQRQQRLGELQDQLAAATRDLDAVLHQQSEKRSRLHVLEQLHAEHEGYGAGTLAALQQAESVMGSLADRIRVPDPYVKAIESALGHHLQAVITRAPEAAQRILEDLSANRRGRASIASLALFNGHAAEPLPLADVDSPDWLPVAEAAAGDEAATPDAPVRAASVVEAERTVRPLVARLLGMTRIVPDLAAATRAWREHDGAFHYVTLSGELLSRHGVYTGGATNGAATPATSILGRKNHIAQLRTELDRLQDTIATLSRHKGALQSDLTELEAGLQETQTALRAQEVAIATSQGECHALQNAQRLLQQRIETVVYEVQSLASQDDQTREQRASLAAQLAELETAEHSSQRQVADAAAALDSLRQERDTLQAELTETKVAVATQEQLCAALQQRQAPLEARIQELTHLADQRREDIGAFARRKTQCDEAIAESRRRIIDLERDQERIRQQAADGDAQKQALDADLDTRENALRALRRRLEELQQHRGALEIELAQNTMAAQNLRDRIRQKYQVNLDDVRSECITITLAEGGPPKVETLTPEAMAAAGVSTDWEAVAGQVTGLQQRLDEMGPVNLVAIEEYEATEQRHQFFTRQHDDLVQAKAQFLEAIQRINRQTRQMFTDTFERIRENFRLMFAEIFGGGKADLILVHDADVLESGIDIVARPPGKQLQSISLLSGGEQTMTAVALLFSIYQVKPSPFCVLDELDAPLDESNITRFIRILQRFLDQSQFIIITHNKRTIGMADVLYGITMQEQGVSRIVSVKFHKAGESVADHKAQSIETPVPGAPLEDQEDKAQPREETLEVVMAK